ncbi:MULTISPECIES: hypothetical protein [unclassified Mesorhizobium]|uniref:hypothetical protein n=1 Tax=unclassified Mesorhizobium TaxID=325217 RepID=UPI00333BD2FB
MDIPAGAWWAIDYHIDWLFGALVLDGTTDIDWAAPLENPVVSHSAEPPLRLIRGTHEDFDLIIAFDRTIVLIEAKGVTSWGNDQVKSKHQRLREWQDHSHRLRTDKTRSADPLQIIVVFASPNKPAKLDELDWPTFVNGNGRAPLFFALDFSQAPDSFCVPERCDADGFATKKGDSWKIQRVKRPRLRVP